MKNIDLHYKDFEKEMAMIQFPIKMNEYNLKIEDEIKIKSQKVFKYIGENKEIDDFRRNMEIDEKQIDEKINKIKKTLNKNHIEIIDINKNTVETYSYEKIVFKEDYCKGKLEYLKGVEEVHFIEITYFDKRYNETQKIRIKNKKLRIKETLEKVKLIYDGSLTKARSLFFYANTPKEKLLYLIDLPVCENKSTNLKQEVLDK